MLPQSELLSAGVLFAWVMIVVTVIAKFFYDIFKRYGHNVAMYYARKVIHILAGGIVSLVIGLYNVFETPILPFSLGLVLALLTYLPHRLGKLMYWFQDPENIYEVDFCIAWAVFMTLGWFIGRSLQMDRPFLFGTLPVLFMAVGDGVTGIVRNALFRRRIKHWSGNVAMFLVSAAMSVALGFGTAGILSALAASMVERMERLGNIILDDNVTVPTVSFAVLFILKYFGL